MKPNTFASMPLNAIAQILLLGGMLFAVSSVVSFFALSDGHGIVQVYDGIKRVGWPLVMFEEGGFIWHRKFNLTAVLGNFTLAACVAVVLRLAWNTATKFGSEKAMSDKSQDE